MARSYAALGGLLSLLLLVKPSYSFVPPAVVARHSLQQQQQFPVLCVSKKEADDDKEALEADIQANLALLYSAAETKTEDSDEVFNALSDLEKQMRKACRLDERIADRMQESLTGSWRLIFTTGTAKTQERLQGRKINYFPLKAVQSFDTTKMGDMKIENGIYLFDDWAAVKFIGSMEFDKQKRRLTFDFDQLQALNGWLKIPLKKGEAAELGSKSGLGSDNNVKNAERGNAAFFNWISADEKIATARGGGGGLALWKRVT